MAQWHSNMIERKKQVKKQQGENRETKNEMK